MNHNPSSSTRNPEARTGSPVRHRSDGGFTLIELLIVVALLGVLASVVVFAVRGVKDRGSGSARSVDERTIVTAEEAYQAQHGTYADEATLVGADMLRNESDLHDITIEADGSYTLAYVGPSGSGATTTIPAPPPVATPVPDTFLGFSASRYGSGPVVVVLLPQGDANLLNDWSTWTASCNPRPSVTLYLVTGPITFAAIDAVGPNDYVANDTSALFGAIDTSFPTNFVRPWDGIASPTLNDHFGCW